MSQLIVRWEIENFLFSTIKNGYFVTSPKFYLKNVSGCGWYMQLYPKGDSKMAENFMSCFLCLEGNCGSTTTFDFEIAVFGTKSNKMFKSQRWSDILINSGNKWGSSLFSSVIDVSKNVYIPGKSILTIGCELLVKTSGYVFDQSFIRTRIGFDRQLFSWYSNYISWNLVFEDEEFYFKNLFFEFEIAAKENSFIVSLLNSVADKQCFVIFTLTLLSADKCDWYSDRFTHLFEQVNDSFEINLDPFENELKNNYSIYVDDNIGNFIQFKGEFVCSSCVTSHFVENGSKPDSILTNKATSTTGSVSTTSSTPSTSSTLTTNLTPETHSSLQEDLKSLFLDKMFCDLKLRVGGEIIEAHKSVLVARSSVFAAMFSHNMLETQSGTVDIVDIDMQTLKLFLLYLYSDKVEKMNYGNAMNLLVAAEKYNVPSLKVKSSIFLISEISAGRVCDILSLADAVNQADLKSASMDFFIKNSAAILTLPQWTRWMQNNMKLATEIFSKLAMSFSSTKTGTD